MRPEMDEIQTKGGGVTYADFREDSTEGVKDRQVTGV